VGEKGRVLDEQALAPDAEDVERGEPGAQLTHQLGPVEVSRRLATGQQEADGTARGAQGIVTGARGLLESPSEYTLSLEADTRPGTGMG
jgi:hypothetical protein